MTQSEFAQWWAYHSAAFPNLRSWIVTETDAAAKDYREQSGDPKAVLPSELKPLAAWARALADVDLEAGKTATDAMVAGDLEKPRSWSDHPAAIRRHAKDAGAAQYAIAQTRRIIDGEDTYACRDCCDRGTVLVLDPRSRSLAESIACLVVCSCAAGDAEAAKRFRAKRREGPRYDPRSMFRLQDNGQPDARQVRSWAEQRQPVGYVEEFADWDQGAF